MKGLAKSYCNLRSEGSPLTNAKEIEFVNTSIAALALRDGSSIVAQLLIIQAHTRLPD